jgi:hypothetical protein
MSKESLDSPGSDRELLREGDDAEQIAAVVRAAIDNGDQDGDRLQIAIPVEADMRLWGLPLPVSSEDGRAGPASELFSGTLSAVVGRDITVYGVASTPNAETGSFDHRILATVASP